MLVVLTPYQGYHFPLVLLCHHQSELLIFIEFLPLLSACQQHPWVFDVAGELVPSSHVLS